MADYKNKLAVLNALQEDGWKISKTQFYEHCKIGLLRPGKDGGYSKAAVEKYAKANLPRLDTGEKVADRADRLREEKQELAVQRERIKLEHEQLDLDERHGQLMPTEDHERAVIARGVALYEHLNHHLQVEVSALIETVNGDQKQAPALIDFFSSILDSAFADYVADAEYDVILEANQ